jgi:hypothetical protein
VLLSDFCCALVQSTAVMCRRAEHVALPYCGELCCGTFFSRYGACAPVQQLHSRAHRGCACWRAQRRGEHAILAQFYEMSVNTRFCHPSALQNNPMSYVTRMQRRHNEEAHTGGNCNVCCDARAAVPSTTLALRCLQCRGVYCIINDKVNTPGVGDLRASVRRRPHVTSAHHGVLHLRVFVLNVA